MPPESNYSDTDEVKNDGEGGVVAPRDTMVSTAVHFLQNPKVKDSPMSHKRAFLLKKGLTNEEIDQAFDKADVVIQQELKPFKEPNHITNSPSEPSGHFPSFWSYFNGIGSSVVIVGIVCYGVYQIYKSFVKRMFAQSKQKEERLSQMELQLVELNRSLSQLHRSLSAVETTVTAQKSQISKLCDHESMANLELHPTPVLLNDIKSEIASLKSLLLNRSQFPAAPAISTIPFWQLPDNTTNEKLKEVKSTDPVNESNEKDQENTSTVQDSQITVCDNNREIPPADISEEKN